MSRRTLLLLIVTVAALLVPLSAAAAPPPPAAPAAPAACGVTWGSQKKMAPSTMIGELVDIRTGRHDCYDRLVLGFTSHVDGFVVSYVDQLVEDPTGVPIPLRGEARLSVAAHGPAYNDNGQPTYTFQNRNELVDLTGYQTFRQLAWAGSFEAITTVGLGVRARLPFRVFTWDNKVIVDVAHTW